MSVRKGRLSKWLNWSVAWRPVCATSRNRKQTKGEKNQFYVRNFFTTLRYFWAADASANRRFQTRAATSKPWSAPVTRRRSCRAWARTRGSGPPRRPPSAGSTTTKFRKSPTSRSTRCSRSSKTAAFIRSLTTSPRMLCKMAFWHFEIGILAFRHFEIGILAFRHFEIGLLAFWHFEIGIWDWILWNLSKTET